MNPRILAVLSSSRPLVAAFERVAAQMEYPVRVVADADAETLRHRAGHLGASCLFVEWDGQRHDAQGLSPELGTATALRAPLVLLAPADAPDDRLLQCLDAGVTDILRCPFSDTDLRGRLRLLGLRHAVPAEESEFVLENAPAGVGLVVERRFVQVNLAMTRLTGLTREELLSRDALDLVHPDDRESVGRNYAARLAGRPVPDGYSFRLQRPDGSIVWVQACATLVQWQGHPATVNVFTDISFGRGSATLGAPGDAGWREVVERTPAMLYEVETFPDQEEAPQFHFVSPQVIALTGYPPSHFGPTTEAWRELVLPEDRAARLEALHTAFAQGRDCVQDYRIVTRDGNVLWVRDHSRVLRAATEDQPALVQGVVVDITQRVEAEEALLRYKAAVESSNDLIVAVDAEGRIILVNDTTLRYYSLTREEAEGSLFTRVISPASADRVAEYFRRCLAGESGTFEITADLPDYPGCTLAVSYAAISDRTGRATGCVVVARDITESRRTQRALEASEERFRRVIELLPLPVLLLRDSQHVEYVNRQFTELLGYTLEEAADVEAWFAIACPNAESRRSIQAAWDRQVREKDWHPMPPEAYDITCKDGSLRNLAFTTVTLNEHDIFIVCEDMTERRQAAEALRKSLDFLETVLHHMPFDFWARDMEQRIILQNAESVRLWGDLVGQSIPETVPENPSSAVVWRSANQRALAGEVVREEVDYVVQGERRHFYSIVAPIPGPGGLQGTLGINVDITDRKRAQDALEKRLRYERCLSDLSRRLLMRANEGERPQTALRPLLEASQSDRVCLSVEGDGEWAVTAGTLTGHRVPLPVIVGVHGETCGPLPARWQQRLKQGLSVHGSARTLSRANRTAFARHNVLSLLAMPVMVDGRMWGVLQFVDMRQERDWDVSDTVPLQTAAEIISTSLTRQHLQREVLEIADREQSRIGQDLHDGICQDLLGISYVTDHLRLELEKKPSLRTQVARLREISEAINQAVTRTRSLARGLSPVELDPDGIADSLEALAEHIGKVFRVECTFESDPGVTVKDPGMATHLYRIVQEATNNSIRHGHAERIRISLRSGRGRCILAIQDDGSGFDLSSPKRGGMGLRIMGHRAEMIDCVFKVRSRPGQGTTITCSWLKENSRIGSASWAGPAGGKGVRGVREKRRPYKTRAGAAGAERQGDAEENRSQSGAGPDEEGPNTGTMGGLPPSSTVIYPNTQREEETEL